MTGNMEELEALFLSLVHISYNANIPLII